MAKARKSGINLRTALGIVVAGSVLYVVGISVFIVFKLMPASARIRNQTERIGAQFDYSRQRAATIERSLVEIESLLNPGASRAAPYRDEIVRLRKQLQSAIDTTGGQSPSAVSGIPSETRVALARAIDVESQLGGALMQTLAHLELGNRDEAAAQLERCHALKDAIQKHLSDAQRTGLADLIARERELAALAGSTLQTITLWGLLGALLIPLIGLFVQRRFYRPLARLNQALDRVSQGKLDTSIRVQRADELGLLSEHFNEMTRVLRARDEEARREREERMRLAIETAQMGTWDWDITGKRIVLDPYAAQLVGCQPNEYDGTQRAFFRFIHPEDKQRVSQAAREAAQSGSTYSLEFRVMWPDGSLHWLSSRGRLFKEEARFAGRMIGVSLDITERKKAEEALRLSEEKFAKAFRASPTSIMISSLNDGRYIEVNDTFLQLTGYRRDEVIGRTSVEMNVWTMPEERERFIQEITKQGAVRDFEARYRKKSGDLGVILLSAEIIDLYGEACLLAAGADITERKKAEEEVLVLARFPQENPKPVLRLSGEGVIVYANPASQMILDDWGCAEGECAPDFYCTIVAEALHSASRQNLELLVQGRVFAFTVTPITEAGYVNLYGEDITERKRAELDIRKLNEELEQRVSERTAQLADANRHLQNEVNERRRAEQEIEIINRELEAFSYSVSHDLRAPLRSIDGFSQALLEDYGERLDGAAKEYLGRVRSASQRMGLLIDDMLNLSRITRSEMRRDAVDLSAMAAEIADELHKQQPARQVEFVISENLVESADARLLHIALQNLLGNAWKFTERCPAARIEFGRLANNGQAAYFVRDNGAGFDMAYAHKLFGAFQRLHSMSEFSGTGVGLATVQRIIHRHGGRIWAEGEVGNGATFYFTL